jgi:CRP-like cAMP-binding protein
VNDDLSAVADRFQALAGVTMGPLGERLDDSLRGMVTDRAAVRMLLPGDVLLSAGDAVDGLYVVGGGAIELSGDTGTTEIGPGEFLFAEQVMGGGKARQTARALESGALLLFVDRMAAHELLVSVPPLLEILAGG